MQSKRMRLMTIVGIVSAIAFVLVATIKIPVVLFLKYEPKDIAITLTGLAVGPLSAVLITIITSFLEMITISSTGIIGFAMNVLATLAFVLPAVVIYRRKHDRFGAVIGLACGVILMTLVMLLWNYIATPIFLNIEREKVVPLLWSAILPFNLLKGGLNAALTYLLYKPITSALKRYGGHRAHKRRKDKDFASAYDVLCICSDNLRDDNFVIPGDYIAQRSINYNFDATKTEPEKTVKKTT